MKEDLQVIADTIRLAQVQLAQFVGKYNVTCIEIDDVELGLGWIMRKLETIQLKEIETASYVATEVQQQK